METGENTSFGRRRSGGFGFGSRSDNAVPDGELGQLRGGIEHQLAFYRGLVKIDSFFGDVQENGNFFIRPPFRHQLEYLPLARAESVRRLLGCLFSAYAGRRLLPVNQWSHISVSP